MKVTGIELLQMIKDEKISENVKVNGKMIYDCNFQWLLKESSFTINQILKMEFEIIKEDKPIEKIGEIRKTLDIAFSNLEDALDKINKLESELEKRNK